MSHLACGRPSSFRERGIEYDTMSGKFADFIEAEVLPAVEKATVKLSRQRKHRAVMECSSGASAAFTMAWAPLELWPQERQHCGVLGPRGQALGRANGPHARDRARLRYRRAASSIVLGVDRAAMESRKIPVSPCVACSPVAAATSIATGSQMLMIPSDVSILIGALRARLCRRRFPGIQALHPGPFKRAESRHGK
jgi:hypothetical protein